MSLFSKVSGYWISCQQELFPWMEETLGSLEGRYKKLLSILEMVPIDQFLPSPKPGTSGRPLKDRAVLARAFLAKMVFNMDTTTALVERLRSDPTLRRLCGWQGRSDVPSASTFSRAFKKFAEADLPSCLHEAVIKEGYEDQLVGHLSRDSTAITGYEKPVRAKKEESEEGTKHKQGRPVKFKVANEAGTAAYNATGGDVSRIAEGMYGGCQAQCSGIYAEMVGIQAALGCG